MYKFYKLALFFFVLLPANAFAADFDVKPFEAAQKFVRTGDYEKARGELEPLLDDLTDDPEKDAALFLQLSEIAELQRDIPGAVRFQEQACERIDSPEENCRLFVLHRRNKENEKAVETLLRSLEKTKPEDSLPIVDILLRYEQYNAASQVLGRLERAEIEDWNIIYRRLMIEYWSGRLHEAKKIAENFISTKRPEEKPVPIIPTVGPNGELLPRPSRWKTREYLQFQNKYSGPLHPVWVFGDSYSYQDDEGIVEIRKKWIGQSAELITTIFRDKIRLKPLETYGAPDERPMPPKPQFMPETPEDARFAARLWLLRIAFQNDVIALNGKTPPESGFLPKFLNEAVVALRNEFPVDAPENEKLVVRLRLETFFCEWCLHSGENPGVFSNAAQKADHISVFYPESFGELDEEYVETHMRGRHRRPYVFFGRFCAQIETALGMRGESDWYYPAYMITLNDLIWEHVREKMESFELDREFETVLEKHPFLRDEFDENDLAEAKQSIRKLIETLQKNSERIKAVDPSSRAQKIDFLLRCWDELDRRVFRAETPESSWNLGYLYKYAMGMRLFFVEILETENRGADLDRINRMLDAAMECNPGVVELYIHGLYDRLLENDWEDTVFHYIFKIHGMAYLLGMSSQHQGNEITVPRFGMYGGMKTTPAFDRIATLAMKRDNSAAAIERRFSETLSKIKKYDELNLKHRRAVEKFKATDPSAEHLIWNENPGVWKVGEVLEQHIMANSNCLGIWADDPHEFKRDEEKTYRVTQEDLDEIERIEKDCYRILDYYFSRFRDPEKEKTKDEAFENLAIVNQFRSFPKRLDRTLEKAETVGELDPESLKPDHMEKMRRYLTEKAAE